MWQGFAENWRAVILAIGLHVLIALLLIVGVNFVTDASSRGNHGQKIVNASVINPDSVSTDMPDAVSPAGAKQSERQQAFLDHFAVFPGRCRVTTVTEGLGRFFSSSG